MDPRRSNNRPPGYVPGSPSSSQSEPDHAPRYIPPTDYSLQPTREQLMAIPPEQRQQILANHQMSLAEQHQVNENLIDFQQRVDAARDQQLPPARFADQSNGQRPQTTGLPEATNATSVATQRESVLAPARLNPAQTTSDQSPTTSAMDQLQQQFNNLGTSRGFSRMTADYFHHMGQNLSQQPSHPPVHTDSNADAFRPPGPRSRINPSEQYDPIPMPYHPSGQAARTQTTAAEAALAAANELAQFNSRPTPSMQAHIPTAQPRRSQEANSQNNSPSSQSPVNGQSTQHDDNFYWDHYGLPQDQQAAHQQNDYSAYNTAGDTTHVHQQQFSERQNSNAFSNGYNSFVPNGSSGSSRMPQSAYDQQNATPNPRHPQHDRRGFPQPQASQGHRPAPDAHQPQPFASNSASSSYPYAPSGTTEAQPDAGPIFQQFSAYGSIPPSAPYTSQYPPQQPPQPQYTSQYQQQPRGQQQPRAAPGSSYQQPRTGYQHTSQSNAGPNAQSQNRGPQHQRQGYQQSSQYQHPRTGPWYRTQQPSPPPTHQGPSFVPPAQHFNSSAQHDLAAQLARAQGFIYTLKNQLASSKHPPQAAQDLNAAGLPDGPIVVLPPEKFTTIDTTSQDPRSTIVFQKINEYRRLRGQHATQRVLVNTLEAVSPSARSPHQLSDITSLRFTLVDLWQQVNILDRDITRIFTIKDAQKPVLVLPAEPPADKVRLPDLKEIQSYLTAVSSIKNQQKQLTELWAKLVTYAEMKPLDHNGFKLCLEMTLTNEMHTFYTLCKHEPLHNIAENNWRSSSPLTKGRPSPNMPSTESLLRSPCQRSNRRSPSTWRTSQTRA